MKFSTGEFIITKKYDQNLRNKMAAFKQETQTRKSVFLTLITTFGLQQNSYVRVLVQNDLTIDIFFDPIYY